MLRLLLPFSILFLVFFFFLCVGARRCYSQRIETTLRLRRGYCAQSNCKFILRYRHVHVCDIGHKFFYDVETRFIIMNLRCKGTILLSLCELVFDLLMNERQLTACPLVSTDHCAQGLRRRIRCHVVIGTFVCSFLRTWVCVCAYPTY